jgi:hypothetical protein
MREKVKVRFWKLVGLLKFRKKVSINATGKEQVR